MPQLDQMSFFSQVFWFFLFFYSLYFVVLKFFLPTIFYILKFRIQKFETLISQIEKLSSHIIRYNRFHVVIISSLAIAVFDILMKEQTYFNRFYVKYQNIFNSMNQSTTNLQTSYYNFLKHVNFKKLALK